jgi:hypothetical protein
MENDASVNLYGKEGHGCTMAAKDSNYCLVAQLQGGR